MNQQTDVAHRQLRDLADFLVTEIALKLQIDHFALVLRQAFNHPEDFADGFPLFEIRIDADFGVFEWSHAGLPFARVKGEISANSEKPLGNVTGKFRRFFAAQPQERFLDNLSRQFRVSKYPGCVTNQCVFIEIQGINDPLRLGTICHPFTRSRPPARSAAELCFPPSLLITVKADGFLAKFCDYLALCGFQTEDDQCVSAHFREWGTARFSSIARMSPATFARP